MSIEYEVYRISPIGGSYYYTATYTRKTGRWEDKNERYYTTRPLLYVGKHLRHIQEGYGDWAFHRDIFQIENVEKTVDYTYEGTTSFVEITEKEKVFGDYELIMNIRAYHTRTGGTPKIIMEDLMKEVCSPRRVLYNLQFYETMEDYMKEV